MDTMLSNYITEEHTDTYAISEYTRDNQEEQKKLVEPRSAEPVEPGADREALDKAPLDERIIEVEESSDNDPFYQCQSPRPKDEKQRSRAQDERLTTAQKIDKPMPASPTHQKKVEDQSKVLQQRALTQAMLQNNNKIRQAQTNGGNAQLVQPRC